MLVRLMALVAAAVSTVAVVVTRRDKNFSKVASRVLVGISVVSTGIALASLLAIPAAVSFMVWINSNAISGIAFQIVLSVLIDMYLAYIGVYKEWTSFLTTVIVDNSILNAMGKKGGMFNIILTVLLFIKSAFDSLRNEPWKSQLSA